MKQKSYSGFKGPKLAIFLIFAGLAAVFLGLGFLDYRENKHQEVQIDFFPDEEAPDINMQELQDQFVPGQVGDPQDHQIIISNNLFSPERRPWARPVSEDPDDARRVQADPGAFRLHGIISRDDERMALIYNRDLPSPDTYSLVRAGQSITMEDNGLQTAYTLTDIHDDYVTIQSGGRIFHVHLFADRPTREDDPREEPEGPPDALEPLAPGTGLEHLMQRLEDDEVSPDPAPSPEDMERLVEEGRMHRIDTPLGPVYRPVR